MERESSQAGRAEVLTQLVRVEGLRENFAASEGLLQQAEALAGSSDVAGARIDLERGPHAALEARSSGVVYWLGPLYNNLGWQRYEAGEFDAALSSFERALEAREGEPEKPAEIEIARYAVAKTLRALGRPDEALLEQCVENGGPDPYFHEELAENYARLGRSADAREQAKIALTLLGEGETARATRLDRLARS